MFEYLVIIFDPEGSVYDTKLCHDFDLACVCANTLLSLSNLFSIHVYKLTEV